MSESEIGESTIGETISGLRAATEWAGLWAGTEKASENGEIARDDAAVTEIMSSALCADSRILWSEPMSAVLYMDAGICCAGEEALDDGNEWCEPPRSVRVGVRARDEGLEILDMGVSNRGD